MDCILNELSVQQVDSVAEANEVMTHFVLAVKAGQQMGLQRIRIPEAVGQNLYSLPLAAHYTVGSWLTDERVDEVLRERFRLIIAYPPLLTTDEVAAPTLFNRSVFCLNEPAGKPEAIGFGVAYLSNRLLISLLTHPQWDTHQLTGWHWYLDDDGQEQTKQVTVPHVATNHHVDQHIGWIQQQQKEGLQRSSEVWEKRAEFFPHLELCGDVQKQLKKVGMSSHLSQIIDRLRVLDSFAARWERGVFDLAALQRTTNLVATGESDSTMNLYSAQRRFKLPDGRRKLFEMHVKTGDLRFHFYADNQAKKVYVGYIGSHLPTSKFA